MKGAGETEDYRAGEGNYDELDGSRREMLTKIGRFAYVAPTLVLLSEPKSGGAYQTRPGRGYGDKNHVHTGPPGLIKNKNK